MLNRPLPLIALFAVLCAGFLTVFIKWPPAATSQGTNLRAQVHTGETLSLTDLPGDLRLVYFGYMSCPDVCLDAALSVGSALKNLEAQSPAARAQVTNVFVTLDPEDDVIEGVYNELGGYMDSRYGGQGVAMRPKDRAEALEMASAYGIKASYPADDFFVSGYRVDHSSKIFLTDRAGRVLSIFPDKTPGRYIAFELQEYLKR